MLHLKTLMYFSGKKKKKKLPKIIYVNMYLCTFVIFHSYYTKIKRYFIFSVLINGQRFIFSKQSTALI